jgi:circadian clock protein KaiC
MVLLARNRLGTRDERFLRVLKLRGSAYLEGLHGFRITDDGLEVYPRLVSPDVPPHYELRRERVALGIEGLTRLLGGGPYRGTTTLIMGPTGTGKTTLALQFVLEGLERSERAVYVNFEENPTQLAGQIASLGQDPGLLRGRGLHLLYRSPVELQIDSIVSEIMECTERLGAKRVVVDAVGDLLLAASDRLRVHCFLYALTQQLAVAGVATVLTLEGTLTPGEGGLSALADNVVVLGLENSGRARRTLQVVKARGIEHDLEVHELRISSKGVSVD